MRMGDLSGTSLSLCPSAIEAVNGKLAAQRTTKRTRFDSMPSTTARAVNVPSRCTRIASRNGFSSLLNVIEQVSSTTVHTGFDCQTQIGPNGDAGVAQGDLGAARGGAS